MHMKTLQELNQRLFTTVHFQMDCPKCGQHKISVVVGHNGWCWNIEKQTLSPSVNFDNGTCKCHFTITDGKIIIHE